ncbi:AAA family ATPase [Petrimonas mucosa]|jgi:KaiC/GvpD/RAD55 family RecA-like ATPase|uniref:Bacterial regulatory s, luxR family protein n=1 Tax=Petrimonas mucosa TaxID=1642646 RepID=A0A1G4G3G2_9BACT|nr:AAA family ATPase [Petrimonas mucosa]SCM55285.1 Bacterial regulatory s, luxR family protein {ECO:0000313/EMBL:EGV43541,1} [Petrimonas mucosa]
MKANALSADEMKSQSVDILDVDIEQFRINNFVKLLGDDLNDNLQQLKASKPADLLEVKTANKWIEQASRRPIPRMLFSEFWFEQELCILFADTNVGKTILAVQIADSISRGQSIPGFKLETKAQKVIYCDFELNDKQFQSRYSRNYEDPYLFSDNFLRVEINPDADFPEDASFEFALSNAIERVITDTGAKIVIIDNITYLRHENERAKDALPLMKHLKRLKNKYNLSLLVLAHTPKRDLTKPLTRNDLQGSKVLMNFCDSSFAIGESSSDSSFRYIKMIKVRSTEHIYDSYNIMVCQITKPDNFLHFNFLHLDSEYKHLKMVTERDREILEEEVRGCILEEPSISAYAIAKRLCPEEKKFSSFKIKILRIYKKIIQDVNLCDEVDSNQQDPFNPEDFDRLNGDE